MEILIGAAAGAAVGILCALFYRKGLKDEMKLRKGALPDAGAEESGEFMKKYDMIMSYDPYGDR